MKYYKQENKVYDCEQVINDYTQLKKRYLDWLYKYAGIFEDIFGIDEDHMPKEFYDDYRKCIDQINQITEKKPYNSFIDRIDEIENQLPWDDYDFKRDLKQDR